MNAIESNQKNLHHVMTTDWANISTGHKLIRVFSAPLKTWPGAKELCASNSARFLTIGSPQETTILSGYSFFTLDEQTCLEYLRNFDGILYWTGGQTPTPSVAGNFNPFDGFFNDYPPRTQRNGCPAISRFGE